MTFIWDGETITTYGELFDAAVAAMRADRAREFLAAYTATNSNAAENLGYIFGYGDDALRRQLYAAFNLTHPVFGAAI